MIDRDQLDARLKGWAEEYGGGRYEHVGWHSRNLLQTLIEHKGFIPNSRGYVPVPIRTAADEVEHVVNEMEAGSWFRQGKVVRCDYFVPNAPMEVRFQLLRQVGVTVGRTAYYDALAEGKQHIAEKLSERERATA